MVGFHGVLRSEFQSKFCFIISEDRPALWSLQYLTKLLNEHSEEQSNVVHLLSFVHRSVPSYGNVKVYDFIRGSYTSLGHTFNELMGNIVASKRNIAVVDDLSLFYILNDRASSGICNFFKQLSKIYSQVVLFCTLGTISKEDIAVICNLAEHVVILKNPEEDTVQPFLCNILTIKPSGKTTLEQSYYEMKDGSVINSERKVDKNVSVDKSDDIMRTLTTFKLTIEDNEKESKNQLYLPYLDAQRTTVPDPNDEFYDDDEEDEDD